MNSFIINQSTHISLAAVRHIEALTEKDRDDISKKLKIDASKFKSRIVYTNKTTELAEETVEDIQSQGLELAELKPGQFVPALNILSVKELKKEDTDKLLSKNGYNKFNHAFITSVKTLHGPVWSTMPAKDITAIQNRAMRMRSPAMK